MAAKAALGKDQALFDYARMTAPFDGVVTQIYAFSGSRMQQGPLSDLVMDSAGNLYGTTYDLGMHNKGQVFELSPSNGSWVFTDLYDFTGGNDGAYPNGVALDGNGNIYGTAAFGGTHGWGVVWEITR